jgi:hypothetical protein
MISPTYALEPAETGIDLYKWSPGSPSATADNTSSSASFGYSAQDWWEQPWGTRNTIDLANLNAGSRHTFQSSNLDFRQRLLSTPQNTIIDAGVGIKTIGFGQNDFRDGLRLSLGGRMGFGDLFTLYGESAWVPGLIESNGFDSLSGLEFETGVMLSPLPYLSFRAAYRRLNLDYRLTDSEGVHSYAEGIIFGTGIHW